jgi:hypothetical protein
MNAPIAAAEFARVLPRPGIEGLRHLPGDDGLTHLPYYDTVRFLADPLAHARSNLARHGRVFRVNHWGGWSAVLIGPEANELVLMDRDRNFSSAGGWGPILHRLFPRGLMLLDFEEHRQHRRARGRADKPVVTAQRSTRGLPRESRSGAPPGASKPIPRSSNSRSISRQRRFSGFRGGPSRHASTRRSSTRCRLLSA